MSRFRSWLTAWERPGDTGSRWVLAGAAIVLAAVIAVAFLTSRTDGGVLRGAGGAPNVSLNLALVPTPITLGDYLLMHRGLTGRPFVPPRSAGQSGQLVTFTITHLESGAADRCRLHWSQLDRDRGQPAAESFWRYEDVLGWPDGLLPQPGSMTTEVAGELWIPLPNPYVDVGWFVIDVRLRCADREVAAGVTGEFRVDPPGPSPRADGTRLP